MSEEERADSTRRGTEPNDKARCKQGSLITRRRFLSGVTAMGLAGTLGLPRLLKTKDAEAAQNATIVADAEIGPTADVERANQALSVRINAARDELEQALLLPGHPDNGDEALYPNKIGNFSKALPHDNLGEVDLDAYNALIDALTTGKPEDFEAIPLGDVVRLVNPQAALALELLGPDSHQLAIPPAPAFSSAQQAAEIAELYWQALTRDVPFSQYESNQLTVQATKDLSEFSDFRGPKADRLVTAATLFRSDLPGALVGPYISQFLWKDIPLGATPVKQLNRTKAANIDFMTTYDSWLAIQNGALPAAKDAFDPTLRYIRNGRDLGEWVRRDFPYQAFMNACLILLDIDAPFDPKHPYLHSRTQDGFATFGAPYILDLVASVANRALKAAWFQKWLVHRRLRPEEFAGRIHNHVTGETNYPIHEDILGSSVLGLVFGKYGTYLLPQAYPEGGPTHPAYVAGHGAFVGACCTVLKAFFDESFAIPDPVVASDDGLSLNPNRGPRLTVGGELNKLAANVALGRDCAGIHYRSCATEGLNLGEAVAIGILNEMRLTYNESFSGFTLTRFDGSTITV